MHGGFLPDGTCPALVRSFAEAALGAWQIALLERGGRPLEADSSLLGGVRMPTVEQSHVLLRHGLGQTFWNTLTITGEIEARGRILAEMVFPDFQKVIEEDISTMGIGHLNKGLLRAHGSDEGGDGASAATIMWFAARDLAFGVTDFPIRPAREHRASRGRHTSMPEHPGGERAHLYMLMNLLLIEFRAERGFAERKTYCALPTCSSIAGRRPTKPR